MDKQMDDARLSVAKLRETTDAFYRGDLGYAAFSAKQRDNWIDIENAGQADNVLAILRGDFADIMDVG